MKYKLYLSIQFNASRGMAGETLYKLALTSQVECISESSSVPIIYLGWRPGSIDSYFINIPNICYVLSYFFRQKMLSVE